MKRRPAARPGSSLIESVFAVLVLAIASAGVFTLFYSNTYGADLSGDQSNAMGDAQTALRTIAADFRSGSAFSTPTNSGGVRVTYSSGSPVEYYQSGTTLYRLLAGTTSTTTTEETDLSSSSGFSLTYYDSSMTALSTPMDSTKYSQAAVVDIKITTTMANTVFGTVSRTVRIVLRNKVS